MILVEQVLAQDLCRQEGGAGVRHSEFWAAVEQVYGTALGRSLVRDLVLPGTGCTAEEALSRGDTPRQVWEALCQETGATDAQRWVYRAERRA